MTGEERLLADLREAYPETDISHHPMGWVAVPKGAQVSVDATLAGLARKLSQRLGVLR